MITQEKISEIRDRASIVEVVSDYVTLKKSGRNFMGLCPFHTEKTPSFTVSEEKGIFHCFGCNTGGGVFQFLMQIDRLSFPEALERVAKRYGIMIPQGERATLQRQANERECLYRINELAAANYQRMLTSHPEGKKALDYLRTRGVDDDTARRFAIGYAPRGGSGLLDVLKNERLSLSDAMRLDLLGQRDPGRCYEKFFARIMFPIVEAAGRVIGFGGRVLDQGLPKYLNSSETPLFRKGATVYGLHQAKQGIRKTDRVVVVEGYLDVVALAQYGIDYVVATLGTALTVNHLRGLARYTKNIIALFDGDEAGQKAAARSFEIFIEAGLLGRGAFLPKGEDPDTYIRRRGKAKLEGIIERSVPLADYYFSWLQQRHGSTLEGKSQTAIEISRVLAKITNHFEADLLVRRAVDSLGIREELLRRPRTATGVKASSATQPPASESSGDDRAERLLVSLMLRYPSIVDDFLNEPEARNWVGDNWRETVDLITREWQEHGRVDVERIGLGSPPDKSSEIAKLALESESFAESELAKAAVDCLSFLRQKYSKNVRQNLRVAIRTAEENKDEQAKRERTLEWQDVKKRQQDRQRLAPKTPTR
ncbi:MAG: DNA primase [Deltaproteobacteria bacterium]|nr:DNA primase [Deltaproteobacteria bacterium]